MPAKAFAGFVSIALATYVDNSLHLIRHLRMGCGVWLQSVAAYGARSIRENHALDPESFAVSDVELPRAGRRIGPVSGTKKNGAGGMRASWPAFRLA
jgi:hypothetical protein